MSRGFKIFSSDQYFDFLLKANELLKQFLHLVLSHNFIGGFEQYGHHDPFVILFNVVSNLCPQSQLNINFVWDDLNIFLGFNLFSLDQNFDFLCDANELLKQKSHFLLLHNF